jgi:hypothetical protein
MEKTYTSLKNKAIILLVKPAGKGIALTSQYRIFQKLFPECRGRAEFRQLFHPAIAEHA